MCVCVCDGERELADLKMWPAWHEGKDTESCFFIACKTRPSHKLCECAWVCAVEQLFERSEYLKWQHIQRKWNDDRRKDGAGRKPGVLTSVSAQERNKWCLYPSFIVQCIHWKKRKGAVFLFFSSWSILKCFWFLYFFHCSFLRAQYILFMKMTLHLTDHLRVWTIFPSGCVHFFSIMVVQNVSISTVWLIRYLWIA